MEVGVETAMDELIRNLERTADPEEGYKVAVEYARMGREGDAYALLYDLGFEMEEDSFTRQLELSLFQEQREAIKKLPFHCLPRPVFDPILFDGFEISDVQEVLALLGEDKVREACENEQDSMLSARKPVLELEIVEPLMRSKVAKRLFHSFKTLRSLKFKSFDVTLIKRMQLPNSMKALRLSCEKLTDIGFRALLTHESIESLSLELGRPRYRGKLLFDPKVLTEMSHWSHLKDLSIVNLNLAEDVLLEILESTQLRSLRFGPEIQLSQRILKAIGAMKSLRSLVLGSLSGQELEAECLGKGLSQLETLTITRLRSDQLAGLESLTALRSLNIQCEVEAKDLVHLSALKNLESFGLGLEMHGPNSEYGSELLTRLSQLPKLKRVELSFIPLQSVSLSPLSELQNLESLKLAYCELNGEHMESLLALTQLKELRIQGNQFSQGDFNALEAFQDLTLLDWRQNPGMDEPGAIDLSMFQSLENMKMVFLSSRWDRESSIREQLLKHGLNFQLLWQVD